MATTTGSFLLNVSLQDSTGANGSTNATLAIRATGGGTTPNPPPPPTPMRPVPPPFVDVAFTTTGQQVTLLVSPNGVLTEFTAGANFQLATGVSSASVAFGPPDEIMVVVFLTGQLYQFDASGTHLQATGVLSAGVGLFNGQEVEFVVRTAGPSYAGGPCS